MFFDPLIEPLHVDTGAGNEFSGCGSVSGFLKSCTVGCSNFHHVVLPLYTDL